MGENDAKVEVKTTEIFDFRKAALELIVNAPILTDFYEMDPRTFQVGKQAAYQLEVKNVALSDEVKLFTPKIEKTTVTINAPPMAPYNDDEFMPQPLWDVVDLPDHGVLPSDEDITCLEIIVNKHGTYESGRIANTKKIYRIDMTQNPPVGYRLDSVLDNKIKPAETVAEETMVAALDFLQPTPKFKYTGIAAGELRTVFEIALTCKRKGLGNFIHEASLNRV